MNINLQNVEELFRDKQVHNLLPEFKHLFDSWTVAQRATALRNLGKRSLMDLLNSLESRHLTILEEYFSEPVTLDKFDYHIVHNIETTPDGVIPALDGYEDFLDMALYRHKDQLYISIWR